MRISVNFIQTLVAAFGILVALGAQAQTYTIQDKKAIKSFENATTAFDARNYALALDLLDEATDREPLFIEAYLMRFEVLTESRDLPAAEAALLHALDIDPDFFPNAWFFLGSLELNRGAYAEGADHMRRFLKYPGTNPKMRDKAEAEIENAAFATYQMAHPVDFEPINMGKEVNTSMPEYYPTITADDRVFIFTRLVDDPEAFRGKNEDFYITSKDDDGQWENAVPLRGINTVYNEGAPSISGDGRVLVFTGCELMGDYGPERSGEGSCDLFISQRNGERWSPPQNLGKNINTGAWESQPSLSADGKTLYFVRGYPTRRGNREQDIFVAKRYPHGTWSKAEKLPMNVNTPGREESVQIHPDGKTLYFSSDGHPGMGGLDIYRTELIGDAQWADPVNLGYPINTYADENSLLVSAGGEVAFFASDRPGGYGDLDLYSFDLPMEARPTAVTYAQGRVIDAETKRPVEAVLKLTDVDSDAVRFDAGNDPVSGNFLVALPSGHTYALSVKSPGYLYHSETFTIEESDNATPYHITVEMLKVAAGNAVVLKNVFFDLDKAELNSRSKPELAGLAEFMRANPKIKVEIAGHTDNQGDSAYNKALSERRATAVKDYLIAHEGISADRIATKGYGAEQPVSGNDTPQGRAKNRRTEFKILKS